LTAESPAAWRSRLAALTAHFAIDCHYRSFAPMALPTD